MIDAALLQELVNGDFLAAVDQTVEAGEEGLEGLESQSVEIQRLITSHIKWLCAGRMHWNSLQPHLCIELEVCQPAATTLA